MAERADDAGSEEAGSDDVGSEKVVAEEVVAFAPGRVNLIGDHTDYAGGLALPMAIHLGTTVRGHPTSSPEVRLTSADQPDGSRTVSYRPEDSPTEVEPAWGRYVAGVVAELGRTTAWTPGGFTGTVTSTLPIGSGLSSSAALELAVALALGFDGSDRELAALGQRAEQTAAGVPCGAMDQLASACGVAGHALFIDFTTMVIEPVPMPHDDDLEIVVVHSGQERALADSAYAERRAACERAAEVIGPLHDATLHDVARLDQPRWARHVVTENRRVVDFADALRRGDLVRAGTLMVESHRSLAGDFAVSTSVLDDLVERLVSTPGVFGARLTGAGFGGCVVALTRPGALAAGPSTWIVKASDGARRT